MNNLKFLSLITMLCMSLFVISCENDADAVDDEENRMELDNDDDWQEAKAEWESEVAEMNEELNDDIAELKRKMNEAEGETAEAYKNAAQELQELQMKLNNQAYETEEELERDWKRFKSNAERTIEDIENRLENLDVDVDVDVD